MDQTPDDFARELKVVATRVAKEVRDVVAKGANNVKRDARANVRKSAPIHHAHAANAITYDDPVTETWFGSPVISSEIGYDKDKNKSAGKRTGPGGLGSILEYGSEHNPPHRDLGRALDVEEPRFEAQLAAVAERLLE